MEHSTTFPIPKNWRIRDKSYNEAKGYQQQQREVLADYRRFSIIQFADNPYLSLIANYWGEYISRALAIRIGQILRKAGTMPIGFIRKFLNFLF